MWLVLVSVIILIYELAVMIAVSEKCLYFPKGSFTLQCHTHKRNKVKVKIFKFTNLQLEETKI